MKNKTRYAVMGMLSFEPMSGYDIKKDIEENLSLFWNESYGQIYSVLRQLEQDKLVSKRRAVQVGRPDKQIYTLTEKGRRELKAYLDGPAEKLVVRDEIILKFAFSFNMVPERTIKILEDEIDRLNWALDRIREKLDNFVELQANKDKAVQLELLGDLGFDYYKMRLRWCRKALEATRNKMRTVCAAGGKGR